tara:strand:+ start:2218 stop:2823 length:606 start_codon:yes stop_codon:yes gene_type:complete
MRGDKSEEDTMKRVDIRIRWPDPTLDTGWSWRLAKGYTKEAWDGKMALHMPVLDMGQAKTRNEWVLSHLPSGGLITVLKRPLKDAAAAVDLACASVDDWRHIMEYDHHAVDAGPRHWPCFEMREFRDAVNDECKMLHEYMRNPVLTAAYNQMFDVALTYADCDAPGCGYTACVEPDADYPCPECDEGRIVSPIERVLGGEV